MGELIFFGIILPPALGFTGYQLLRHGDPVAAFLVEHSVRRFIDWGLYDRDSVEGSTLLVVWLTGLALVAFAVFLPLRVLHTVVFG